jgi:Ni/Co efflux regulator RcnB
MKKILSAALAVSLIASAGAASAAPNYNHQQNQRIEKLERKADKAERKAHRAHDRYQRVASRRYNAGRYQRPSGYQQRQWRHGERLPSSYRTRGYVVDYNRYQLQAPPRGYQYVRVGNDVALTSSTNGLIASVILGLFQ